MKKISINQKQFIISSPKLMKNKTCNEYMSRKISHLLKKQHLSQIQSQLTQRQPQQYENNINRESSMKSKAKETELKKWIQKNKFNTGLRFIDDNIQFSLNQPDYSKNRSNYLISFRKRSFKQQPSKHISQFRPSLTQSKFNSQDKMNYSPIKTNHSNIQEDSIQYCQSRITNQLKRIKHQRRKTDNTDVSWISILNGHQNEQRPLTKNEKQRYQHNCGWTPKMKIIFARVNQKYKKNHQTVQNKSDLYISAKKSITNRNNITSIGNTNVISRNNNTNVININNKINENNYLDGVSNINPQVLQLQSKLSKGRVQKKQLKYKFSKNTQNSSPYKIKDRKLSLLIDSDGCRPWSPTKHSYPEEIQFF